LEFCAMDRNQAVEDLKHFILEHDLPGTDMALFGVGCPYCGKSDRIRELEAPGRLDSRFQADEASRYAELWSILAGADGLLGICKFCQNVVGLDGRQQAAALYE
jgi:hypothetical protein